jgi:hypothetical protein
MGTLGCGAITSSGTLGLGTNAINCGAITSSGTLGLGTNAINCGAITSSGTLGLGTNAINCGAITSSGSINTTSQFVANVDATNTNPLTLANNAASGSLFQVLQTGTSGGWLNNCVAGDTSLRSFGKLLLAAGSTNGTGILNASIILGNSNYCVGIGSNVNPSYNLDVVGTTRHTTASSSAGNAPDGGANHGLMLVSTKAPDSGKTAYSMALGVDSGTGYAYINAAGNTTLQPILLQSRGGGVGINLTTAPQAALDVNGSGRFYQTSGASLFVGNAAGASFTVGTGSGGYAGLVMNGYFQVVQNGTTNNTFFTVPSDANQSAWYSNGTGNFGVGTTTPGYKLDVNGNANVAPASGGALYVGTSNGLLVYGASNDHGYIRADISTTSSDKILYLGTGQSNIAEISRSNVVFYPSNAVYVKSNAGSGNFVVEGTSYLKDISNTNVYSTGAFFSGTTAGRLAMVGVQNACYIEAALNSDTGSAAPLYFTDMNNANQWMCIGSTGNVGINNNSPVGRFHVRTSGNALDTFLGWDSTWMVVTPSANATTAKNTPGLGLGYSVAANTGYVTALAPNDTWKHLNLDGSNVNITPHGGSLYIRGQTQVVMDSNSIVTTTPSGASTYPTNAFIVQAQMRAGSYNPATVFSVTTYTYSTSYTSSSVFLVTNPTHYMIVTAWQDNGNWFSGALLYSYLGAYSNAGSFVGNLSVGVSGAGIKFTNMTPGIGFRCTMIAISAGIN